MCGGCSSAHNDELNLILGEQSDQCVEICHCRDMASLPARRNSSANCCNFINCWNLSSTLRRRFSRISVRSTSFLYASIIASTPVADAVWVDWLAGCLTHSL